MRKPRPSMFSMTERHLRPRVSSRRLPQTVFVLTVLLVCAASLPLADLPAGAQAADDSICLLRYDSNDSDGNESGLYTAPVSGGKAEPLAGFGRANTCPSWSPTTDRVVFSGRVPNNTDSELFVSRRDGSDRRRLTWNRAWESTPRFDPVGRRIAFDRHSREGAAEVRVMRLSSRDTRTVTRGRLEDWSPDGRKLLVSRDRKLFIVNLRTNRTRRLTPKRHRFGFHSAGWSHAGGRIAMVGGRVEDAGGEPWLVTALFTIRRDGSGLRGITPDATDVPRDLDSVTWFPDDSRILFSGCRYGCRPYTIRPDGTDLREIQILNGAQYDDYIEPTWTYR